MIRSTEATSPLYCGAHRNFALLTSQQELLNGSIRVTIEENSDIIWTGMMCLRKGLAFLVGGCAYKSLARTERKQATANKLGIYSTYSTRSSINFLARCSNFCKPLKKNIRYLSVQPSLRGSNDLRIGQKITTDRNLGSLEGDFDI